MDKKEFRKMRRKAMLGDNNPRWNNGVSEYPNHIILKKNRIKILKKTHGKCELCGISAKIIHHKDGSKNNHDLKNLIALCRNCHNIIHTDDSEISALEVRGISKYKRLYGLSLKELGKLFNVHPSTILYWLKNPYKKQWLEKQIKNNT